MLCVFVTIKLLFKTLGINASVVVENVGVNIRDHLDLRVSRITLYRLNIAAVEFELVSDARMTETVEHNRRQIIVPNQFCQRSVDDAAFYRSAA